MTKPVLRLFVLWLISLQMRSLVSAQLLCFGEVIDKSSMNVTYYSRLRRSDNSWELGANITWQRPEEHKDFDAYALRAELRGNGKRPYSNCSLAGLSITRDEAYTFTGLHYGYSYMFAVSTVDRDQTRRTSFETTILRAAPDCYLETGDRDFCRTQSVQVAGVPLDFQMDCTAPSKHSETANDQYTVVLSWTPPIQVNGDLHDYELRYGEYGHELKSFDSAQIEANENTTVYIEVLQGLQAMTNYTATVRAFVNGEGGPMTYLHFNTYSEEYDSSRDNGICDELMKQGNDATSLPQQSVTEQAPSVVASVLGPILTVSLVVGGAVLVRYVLKRKKDVADSKEAIFVRYPEEGGGRKGLNAISKDNPDGASGGLLEPDVDFQSKEVDRSLLTINKKLGNGQFGVVYSGILSPLDNTNKKYSPRIVAVKSLKLNATREMKEDFLDEIKLIIDIGNHPNILPILGCCTLDEPYYLIMEYMKYGDLLGFLGRCREEKYQSEDPIYHLTETGQLQIARQIARGMEYLSNTRFYHGDLAARNVLVGEGLVVKISDFGMADDIYQRGYKRLGQEKKRPLKWVSLETNIKGTCSIKSDVWSFGIVLYEIYTLGGAPYPGMDGFEVVRQLEDGYRMEQPESCPDEMYIVMLECWHEKPDLRPTFTELFNNLDHFLSEKSSEYFTELDFEMEQISHNMDCTTYGYQNNLTGKTPVCRRSDDANARYDSLQAIGSTQVPRVTVECMDNTLQMEICS